MEKEVLHAKIAATLVEAQAVVVPLLGDDIFQVSPREGEAPVSLQSYLLECFVAEYGGTKIAEEDLRLVINGGYYGLSKLERLFPMADFEFDYRRYLRQAWKEGRVAIKPQVQRFLETFQFPLLITTSAFHFLESLLPGIHYATASYAPRGAGQQPLARDTPTVYHIFGTTDDGQEWVYDEDKLLRFLHALHNADTTPVALRKHLESRNCRLLALGCNLPDWLFRFLWFPIQGVGADMRQKKGYWISSRENSESFNDFLEHIKFYTSQEVDAILAAAVEEQQRREAQQSPKATAAERFDAFLAYASEDKPLAQRVFDILTQQGYKIWFDKEGTGRIEAGSNYMLRIADGISRSAHYLPLITENFLAKVCNPESNLKREMDLVRDHLRAMPQKPERYSVPIVVEGRRFNDEPITNSFVEAMTRFLLPKELFLQINMYSFTPGDTSINFTL